MNPQHTDPGEVTPQEKPVSDSLPWTVYESALSRRGELWFVVTHGEEHERARIAEVYSEARARYIVTACNGYPALREAAEKFQWSPIETAPKDGAVLVFCPPDSRCVAKRGVYRYGFGGDWQSVPGQYSVKPTHWMPLPQPPALAVTAEGANGK